MSRANPRFKRINAPLATLLTNAVRLTVFYLVDQQICIWTCDFEGNSTTYSGNGFESAFGSSFLTSQLANLRACLSSDCSITQVKVQSLTQPNRLPGITAVATASQAGTVAGTHLPSEMAVVVSKATPVKGQHGRGRLYLPGIPSGFVTPATDANRLNASGSAAVTTLVNGISGFTYLDGANTYAPAVTQRVTHGAPTTAGTFIAFWYVRLLLGVVRRRRIGRGK